jgi:hypothetical protein
LTQALWNIVRPLAESYELMHAHARTMMTLSQVILDCWGKSTYPQSNYYISALTICLPDPLFKTFMKGHNL